MSAAKCHYKMERENVHATEMPKKKKMYTLLMQMEASAFLFPLDSNFTINNAKERQNASVLSCAKHTD